MRYSGMLWTACVGLLCHLDGVAAPTLLVCTQKVDQVFEELRGKAPELGREVFFVDFAGGTVELGLDGGRRAPATAVQVTELSVRFMHPYARYAKDFQGFSFVRAVVISRTDGRMSAGPVFYDRSGTEVPVGVVEAKALEQKLSNWGQLLSFPRQEIDSNCVVDGRKF